MINPHVLHHQRSRILLPPGQEARHQMTKALPGLFLLAALFLALGPGGISREAAAQNASSTDSNSSAPSSTAAVPFPSYQEILPFDGIPAVRIQKGDNPEWKAPGLDDSQWKRISLPSQWEQAAFPQWDGICWYRITFQFPEGLPDQPIGISLGEIFDADQTYFNGVLIGGEGDVDNRQKNAFEKDRIYPIPSKLIRPGRENVIAIRVRGIFGQSGPIKGRFALGPWTQIYRGFFTQNLFNFIPSIIYLFLGLYFVLFYLRRPQDKGTLAFAGFSLTLALYTFLRTEFRYWVISSFSTLKHIETFALLLLPALLMLFMLLYFHQRRRLFHDIYLGFSLVMAAAGLLFISDAEIRFSVIKFMQVTWLLPAGTIIAVLAGQIRKGSRDARLMAAAIAVIFIFLILDILTERNLIDLPSLTPYGFLLFVLSLALVLSNRFVRLHHQVQELNQHLEQKVEERTEELNQALKAIKEKDARILMEMQMAGEIQQTLLPEPLPAPGPDISLIPLYEPFRAVSGDFYDHLTLADGRPLLLLADASGHGMPAALITILAKKSFFKAAASSRSPAEVLTKVNRELCGIIKTSHYLTAVLLAFGPEGRVTFANAGHTPCLLYQAGKTEGSRISQLTGPGMFVGAVEEADDTYQDRELPLNRGDRILLYTDCLLEGGNGEEDYGEKRLLTSFRKHILRPAQEVPAALVKDLKDFTAGRPLKDDLTLILAARD